MDRRAFLQMAGAGTAFGAIGLATNRAVIASVTAKSARQPAGLNASETVIVPLKLVNIGDETVKVYKMGIEVRLGGGEPRLYTFDTGSSRGLVGFAPCAT